MLWVMIFPKIKALCKIDIVKSMKSLILFTSTLDNNLFITLHRLMGLNLVTEWGLHTLGISKINVELRAKMMPISWRIFSTMSRT